MWRQAGTLALHAREGDAAPSANGVFKEFIRRALPDGAVSRSPAQTRSYNACRQLIYRANFTDGSQAILSTALP